MYLAPQHFQAQRHDFESSLAHTVEALFRFAHGWTRIALDSDALAGGRLVLEHASGILPDATPISVPDVDAPPPSVSLADRFAPDRDSHIVHLALRAWRPDAPNVDGSSDEGRVAHGTRFSATTVDVRDETTGQDVAPIEFATKNLRFALDAELAPDDVSLPIARVRRDGAGRFVTDPEYVPPCLQLAASESLLALLRGIVATLKAKGDAVSDTLAGAAGGAGQSAAAYVGNELAMRWLLHAMRSAEPALQHMLDLRVVHPERAWLELSRLAGALCTFSLTSDARDLPAYDHENLGGCFSALARQLRAHFDAVVSSHGVVIRLEPTSELLHVGTVADPRCYQQGARWFLGVRSRMPQAQLLTSVPELLKVCSRRFVMELVRRAYPGMALEHVPSPPSGLSPRRDLAYFEITFDGPCAQTLRELHEIGVYVPDVFADASLELAILVPS